MASAHRAARDRFIGRHAELRALRTLISSGSRAVTVVGPGGMGKTRLLHELARASASPVVIVDLASCRDLESLCVAVAAALSLDPGGPEGPERVGRALAHRGALLLGLDNLEQVAAPAATAVVGWLDAAPELVCLCTSREPLGIAAETVLPLGPLALPGVGGADLEESEAAALFIDRARRASADFEVGAEGAARVAALVRGLEGLPLAIELAAAHVDVLGLDGLLDRLPRRLDALRAAGPSTPLRHSTLRHTVEWSWDLLDDGERRALARASVFRGGFDADAAEAVLGHAAVTLLAALRRKSLLLVISPPGAAGPPRLGMLEAVHDLAAERLAAAPSEHSVAWARHSATFAASGLRRAEALAATGDLRVLASLVADRENLLAAFEWALPATPGDAMRLALALEPVFEAAGPYSGAVSLLDRVVAACSDCTTASLACRARRARGRFLLLRGRSDAALADLTASVSEARALGEPAVLMEALRDLGVTHHHRRATDEARAAYVEALALARSIGDPRAEGRLLGNLGALHHDRHALDAAADSYRRALAVLREVGDVRLEGIFLLNLALLEQELGEMDSAREDLVRARERLGAAGDRRIEAIATSNLGALLSELSRFEEAVALHEHALGVLRSVGDERSLALGLARLGGALAELLRLHEARDRLDDADLVAGRLGDGATIETVQLYRAFIDHGTALRARAGGDPEDARKHVERARRRVEAARTLGEASDDARLALRVLDRLVGDPREASGGALHVGDGGRWFLVPGGEAVDLSRRKVLRGVLLALAQAQATGKPIGLEALREAGWPGEKMSVEAATNRIHVALAALRQLGLRDLIVHDEQGYRLDGKTPVVLSQA